MTADTLSDVAWTRPAPCGRLHGLHIHIDGDTMDIVRDIRDKIQYRHLKLAIELAMMIRVRDSEFTREKFINKFTSPSSCLAKELRTRKKLMNTLVTEWAMGLSKKEAYEILSSNMELDPVMTYDVLNGNSVGARNRRLISSQLKKSGLEPIPCILWNWALSIFVFMGAEFINPIEPIQWVGYLLCVSVAVLITLWPLSRRWARGFESIRKSDGNMDDVEIMLIKDNRRMGDDYYI